MLLVVRESLRKGKSQAREIERQSDENVPAEPAHANGHKGE